MEYLRRVTPSLAAVHDACVQRAAGLEAVSRIRAAFERASGAFTPDDAFYEERAAALWDRVVTDPEVVAELARTDLPAWVAPCLGRAQRGLFEVRVEGEDLDLACMVTGATFRLSRVDSEFAPLRTGRDLARGERLDAFVVPTSEGASLLPGALAHPASARVAMDALLSVAVGPPRAGFTVERAARDALFDLLLGMRHRLKTQGRMRPEVVYRLSARAP